MINDCFISRVLTAQKLIYTKFLQPVESEVYRQAMLSVYENIQKNNLEYWIMDSTKSNFTMQDQKWSVEHLGVLLQGTQLKKVALVRDHDVMLQIVAESMRAKIYRIFGDRIELFEFSSLKEALQSLLPKENPDILLTQIQSSCKT